MTSKFKALTENTPPLSSGASTEAKGQQSSQSAATTTVGAQTPHTMITQTTSESTLTTGKSVSEKSRVAAMMVKAALARLEKDGLIKRYRVLSEDKKKVVQVMIGFPANFWSGSLDLLLSGEDNSQKISVGNLAAEEK